MTDSPEMKVALLGLEPEAARAALLDFFEQRGAPPYRAEQVLEWLYRRAATFDEMTNLSRSDREALAGAFTVTPLRPAVVQRSTDGTVKHLWSLQDGEQVESVLIPAGQRLTLCLSSQAGCALGCAFCATGAYGFRRHLSADEIVAQYRDALRYARELGMGPIRNVVFMGMGEPLANPDGLFPALSVLNHGFGLGARRITVSTVGLVPGIRRLAQRPEQFRLAVSLHAPVHELRLELVPVEKRYPLPDLMAAIREFVHAGGKRVTFEYTLIAGINDDITLADALADLVGELRPLVNLIPMNPIPFVDWRPSAPAVIERFRARLVERGVKAEVREPRGRDIAAACGQLRNAAAEPGLPVKAGA